MDDAFDVLVSLLVGDVADRHHIASFPRFYLFVHFGIEEVDVIVLPFAEHHADVGFPLGWPLVDG